MSNKIRFAVIGCGHIGKRHAEMITRNPDAELAALCDVLPRNSLGLDAYDVPFYSSLEQLLAGTTPFDVLSICTPNGWHASMAISALEHGKHAVIEKPMALSTSDADRVIETAEKYGKRIFCVMQNRYSPPSAWVKEVVESGILGSIRMVQLNCYWNRDERYYQPGSWHGNLQLDGGTLFTQFSHFIDIMYWLFGTITDVKASFNDFAHAASTDFEDSGFVQFNFVKGGMGCFNYSTAVWDKNLESSLTIIAENGSIKVGGQYMNEVDYCHIRDYEMPPLAPTNPGNDYGAYKGSAQNHHFVIQNIIDVLSGTAEITTTAQEGRDVVAMIEQIYSHKKTPKG